MDFPLSCAAGVRGGFERGVAMLHSFWYDEASRQFSSVLQQDPHCAMAYWGRAMTAWRPVWDGLPADRREAALQDIDAASHLGSPSDRERAYIAALRAYLHAPPTKDQQPLRTYAEAMGQLHARHPEDAEAQAFEGLAWVSLSIHDPQDPIGDARRALAILEPGFRAHPDHPGYAHYIIHACDTPQLAREGLAAAERYAAIAPASSHAQHMPSHIFARLGMWGPDIRSNWGAVRAAEAAAKAHHGEAARGLHPYDFLLYAYLQDGEDGEAEKVRSAALALAASREHAPDEPATDLPVVATYKVELSAIDFLERRRWADVLSIPAPPGAGGRDPAYVESRYAYDWARAIAAGRLHDAAAADQAVTDAQAVYAVISKAQSALPLEDEARLGSMRGWRAYAHHQDAQALAELAAAADEQDRAGQAEVDIPVREMYADMLLAQGRAQDALLQYRRSLQLSPNRFNGLAGAAQAARRSGLRAEAHVYDRQLLQTTDGGRASSRPEIQDARDDLTESGR